MSSKTVVVTGATGLIGRALVHALLRQGFAVIALVRQVEAARQSLPPDVALLPWRGDAPPGPEAFARPVFGVVHLAGETLARWPWSRARRETLRRSRVEATRHLVTAVKNAPAPPAVWISASGMGYHGDAGHIPVTEDAPPGKGFLADLAAAWEAEALALTGGNARPEHEATRVVLLRFGMVLAPDGGALLPLRRVYGLGLGGRLGSGRQGHAWIHRDDAVGLILHALNPPREGEPLRGPVHACVQPVPSQAEFSQSLARRLRRPAWAFAPGFALRLVLGGFADLLLHGQYSEAGKIARSGYRWRHSDLASALSDCLR